MQIKIFNSNSVAKLEEEVNRWLAENEEAIDIKQVLQSECVSDSANHPPLFSYTMTVYYLDLH